MRTERLVLEPWHERWREPFREQSADRETMRYIGTGETWTRDRADAVFDEALAHWREHGFGWRSALDAATGDWLGYLTLNYVGPGTADVPVDEVEIGWSLVGVARGRGYATEGGAAIRDEAFDRLGRERVIARVQPPNVASARVAAKLGLRLEFQTTGRHGETLDIYALAREL